MISNTQATYDILNLLELAPDRLLGATKKISAFSLIEGIISSNSIETLGNGLNISRNTLKSIISKNLDSYGETGPAMSWDIYLLSLISCKRCTKCHIIKDMVYFYKDKSKSLGIQPICKECHYFKSKQYRAEHRQEYLLYLQQYRITHAKEYLARTRKYKLSKIQRVPKWAELDKIKEIYKNCPSGYHVDHILPLNGRYVSGLHVAGNLQYLSPEDNLAKGNKYNPSVANIG